MRKEWIAGVLLGRIELFFSPSQSDGNGRLAQLVQSAAPARKRRGPRLTMMISQGGQAQNGSDSLRNARRPFWDLQGVGRGICGSWTLSSVGSERRPYKAEVVGSNPTASTEKAENGPAFPKGSFGSAGKVAGLTAASCLVRLPGVASLAEESRLTPGE